MKQIVRYSDYYNTSKPVPSETILKQIIIITTNDCTRFRQQCLNYTTLKSHWEKTYGLSAFYNSHARNHIMCVWL